MAPRSVVLCALSAHPGGVRRKRWAGPIHEPELPPCQSPTRRLYRANISFEVVSWTKRSRSDGSASLLLFVRTVLPIETLKRRLDGLPRLAVRPSKIMLAVPVFTVQNGHA